MKASEKLATYIQANFLRFSYCDFEGIKNCDDYQSLVILKELVKEAINEVKYDDQ